jgi:arsenate reductase
LVREMTHGEVEVFSAGLEPSRVHPAAIAAMAEIGIDIGDQRSQHVNEFLQQEFDDVLTVCDSAAKNCPMFPGPAQRTHWSVADPGGFEGNLDQQLARFRVARETLRNHLAIWLDRFVSD